MTWLRNIFFKALLEFVALALPLAATATTIVTLPVVAVVEQVACAYDDSLMLVTSDNTLTGPAKAGTEPMPCFGRIAQSVAAKSVVDKSWKLKIRGSAWKTGTPGQQFWTHREAIAEAKNPDVASVRLDHGYMYRKDMLR